METHSFTNSWKTTSRFSLNRNIIDNIMIAQEIYHSMHINRGNKKAMVYYKLDMEKAFNRVRWTFLEELMQKMGFHTKLIKWKIACVSSARKHFILNNFSIPVVIPTDGLRQGYPFSPFLFILCANVSSCMINKAQSKGQIAGFCLKSMKEGITYLICRRPDALWNMDASLIMVIMPTIQSFKTIVQLQGIWSTGRNLPYT